MQQLCFILLEQIGKHTNKTLWLSVKPPDFLCVTKNQELTQSYTKK